MNSTDQRASGEIEPSAGATPHLLSHDALKNSGDIKTTVDAALHISTLR